MKLCDECAKSIIPDDNVMAVSEAIAKCKAALYLKEEMEYLRYGMTVSKMQLIAEKCERVSKRSAALHAYAAILVVVTQNAVIKNSCEACRVAVRDKGNTVAEELEKNGNRPKSSGGCYVATSVYGSYDCPEVWTLRRYRDDVLSRSWLGRRFIKTYYAVSPGVVRIFGNTAWFNKAGKAVLDRIIQKIQKAGS